MARSRTKIEELSHFMKGQRFLDSNEKIQLVRLHPYPPTHIVMCCSYGIQNELTKAETKFGRIEPLKWNSSSTNLEGAVLARLRSDGGNLEGITPGKNE